ncbi:MAG: YigZ family protein [Lachnospiraceae bacterium]|nr:YigZ family protein [Lachnospiraceae bacterium]MBR5945011.1 YigZ family protein [Lachnospiraceae bacterium]
METAPNKEFAVVTEGGVGEVVEKKSRFIATIRPVSSEEEATAFIDEMKKKYWDARHNCSAFIVGEHGETTRCSDDGEPSGTAGRPMLEVLSGMNLKNVAVVVTRYFGGVLLGTGGLVRAYQAAVKEGLNNSKVGKMSPGVVYRIGTDYNGLGKIRYVLSQEGIEPDDIQYKEDVEIVFTAWEDNEKKVLKSITECTSGRAKISEENRGFFLKKIDNENLV